MTEDDARDVIVRQWLALPPEDRATDAQAEAFAMKMAERYEFGEIGDRSRVIMGWLLSYVGRRQAT